MRTLLTSPVDRVGRKDDPPVVREEDQKRPEMLGIFMIVTYDP